MKHCIAITNKNVVVPKNYRINHVLKIPITIFMSFVNIKPFVLPNH
jgi:hypothetical protein